MPEYFEHDAVRERATEVAAECENCQVRSLSLIDGEATHYVFCDHHHRELYAEYAEHDAEASEGRKERAQQGATDVTEVDVGRLAATLDGTDVTDHITGLPDDGDPQEAVAELATLAERDPQRAVPAVEPLVRILAQASGPGPVGRDTRRAARSALARIALVDDGTLELLVDAVDHPLAWRGRAVAALESVAKADPDRLLSAGQPLQRDGVEVPRAVDHLADLGAQGRYDDATRVLLPVARHRPGAVVPAADRLTGGLRADDAKDRFRTAALLGRTGGVDPEILRRSADRLGALYEQSSPLDRGAGAVALSRWPDDSGRPVEEDRLRETLRDLLDPVERDEQVIHEAVGALGSVGTATDVELLEWIQLPNLPEDIHRAAEQSLGEIDHSE